jgi:hypothetical protein
VRSSPLRLGLAAALAGALALAVSSVAAGDTNGVYTVESCTGTNGAPNVAAGWVSATGGGSTAANDCLQGGGLVASLAGPNPAPASAASWTFTAPAGTSIVNVAAQRHTTGVVAGQDADQKGAPTYALYLDNSKLDSCDESNTSECQSDLSAPVSRQGLAGSQLSFAVQCGSSSIEPPCQNAIGAVFTSVAVGLRDPQPPLVSGVQVLDDGQHSGTLTVAYNATDQGGGVYRTIVKVDGAPFSAAPVAPGTACAPANPADGDVHEFTVPVPCPPSVSGVQVSVPVSSLPPGPHGVEIDVEDAAGNTTSVYGPVPFPLANVGSLGQRGSSNNPSSALVAAQNARLRMWFVLTHTQVLHHAYGTRVVTRGVLVDDHGHGIVGARVSVYHVINHNRRTLLKTGLKSRAGGALTLILPINLDTREIEYDYQALIPGPVTSRQILHLFVTRNGRLFIR